MKPKIIFFGSDKYSQIVLKALEKDKRFQIVKNLKDKPDVGVLASYGKILSPEILVIPKYGILNIHPSLLPKYRGASPVQTVILAGDKETGVSIIKMDEKVDHGPIVAQFTEKILPADTAESLYLRLFAGGTEVLLTILPTYLKDQIELRQQNHSQSTHTKKLSREDGKIDWKWSPEKIERHVRAMHPWPGAFTNVKIKNQISKRLKILKAHLERLSPNTCRLIPDLVQLEGKKPVTWKQFCEGYPEAKIIK